ncbi:MAG: glycosyltransferase family 4 protein [bacterium]
MYSILFVNWRDIANPEAGGAEIHLHEISRRMASMGHRVTVLASFFSGADGEEVIDGVRIIRRGGKFTFNWHVPLVIRQLVRKEHFDVVVDDVNKIPFYTPLYVRKPLLAISHHLFARTIFLETAFPLALYVYASELLIPIVYRNTRIVAVSRSTKQDLVSRGIPSSNISVIHNAVDHSRYNPDFSKKSPKPLVAYLGRIKRYKRVDVLLKAFKAVVSELKDARLAIAGSGDFLEDLKKLAFKLGISDYIEFLGFVSEETKIELLCKAHVVVNTSSKEGWGVTVIEANACGTPVIASDVPGLRDAVVDGRTGLLVPYGDIDALSCAMIKVLKDHELRRRISEEAISWAKRFSWDESARAMIDVIREVIENRGTGASAISGCREEA